MAFLLTFIAGLGCGYLGGNSFLGVFDRAADVDN